MNKLVLATLTGITLLAIATPALAYRGDQSVKGPNYTPERHEAMEQAMEKNDYQSWLKVMENRAWGIKQVVKDEATFKEFAAAHLGGDDALASYRAKYNLSTPRLDGSRMGNRFNR